MGGCVSRGPGCGGLSQNKGNDKRARRRINKRRRASSRRVETIDVRVEKDRAHANPISQEGGIDTAWSDAVSVLESERDDEFFSVRDDVLSVVGSERNSIGDEVNGLLLHIKDCKFLSKSTGTTNGVTSVLVDEVSVGFFDGDIKQGTHNFGFIPHTCLPCLPSSQPSAEKKRLSPAPSILRRRPTFKLSFGRKGEHATPTFLPKTLIRRPVAGSSIPYCHIEKKMPDCWSYIEPSSFKVRGYNYFRDKRKNCAPNNAAFYPFGADVFLSQRKIHHVARFIELPNVTPSEETPCILIVNVQIPLYPATIFQSENDGEGMNIVMYFQISESYSKSLPLHFRENIIRLFNDEVERVRGFPMDSIAPFRERLKILGRIANLDALQLSSAEKKLMNAYNEKPVLSRPQHDFFLGDNYVEIDLDVHRFSYISRKGIEAFHDKLKHCNLDFALTIQGQKMEEVPEHILCCIRLNEIDYTKYDVLGC